MTLVKTRFRPLGVPCRCESRLAIRHGLDSIDCTSRILTQVSRACRRCRLVHDYWPTCSRDFGRRLPRVVRPRRGWGVQPPSAGIPSGSAVGLSPGSHRSASSMKPSASRLRRWLPCAWRRCGPAAGAPNPSGSSRRTRYRSRTIICSRRGWRRHGAGPAPERARGQCPIPSWVRGVAFPPPDGSARRAEATSGAEHRHRCR